MKKILISCTYFLPNISGVTVYVDLLAKKLVERKFDVSILTAQYDKKSKVCETVDGVKIRRSRVWLAINKGVIMPEFIVSSFKMVKKTDIVIANLPQVESVFLGLWSKLFRKKFIIVHHCEFNFRGTISNKIISLLSYPIHLLAYFMADTIVSYTSDYAKTSIFLKHLKNKLVIILPPVFVAKQNKVKQKAMLKRIDKKTGQKIIGFVGRVAWEKGINHLIKAVKKIDHSKLVLVGPYSGLVGDKSFTKLEKLIRKNKGKVVLWGPTNHNNLVNFYNIFDCLVLPSTNNLETFGIVQAEAMVSGCPVVASNLVGVRIPIKITGLGEIAKVGDSLDLAKKIEKVIKTKYDKKLFDKARDIFSLDKFSENWVKLLKNTT